MNSRIEECYEQSPSIAAVFGIPDILDSDTLLQLRERLDGTGIDYSLSRPDPAFSLPLPKCLACQSLHYDGVMYLIVERSRRARTLQRFRLFLDGDRPVCIEDDFAHKNPYEF